MKKWLLVLGIATCLLGLTACGSAKPKEEAEVGTSFITNEQAIEYANSLIEEFNYVNDQNLIEDAKAQYEAQVPGRIDALDSWLSALEEIGSYEEASGHVADIGAEEATITFQVKGSERSATVTIQVSKEVGDVINMTVAPKYTLGELMTKAGLNTILGMGTTFAILILISLIISGFNLIPRIQAAFGKKTKMEEIKVQAMDQTIAQIIAKEEQTDDSELIAVITAAIAAGEGKASPEGFRVRSIKRANTSKWKQA